MKKVGIIHTTPATIESLKRLVTEIIQEVEVINILDDSILGNMCSGTNVEYVRKRWISYAEVLENLGVDAVLSACSTVGEFAEEADEILKVPVYRIDEAMAEKTVKMGTHIAVFATLNSTLMPTTRLIQKKAAQMGKTVEIENVLVEGAYDALMQGNKQLHNQKIAEKVSKHSAQSDVLVFAQASMASAVEGIEDIRHKVLTSPELGIMKLKRDLEKA